MWYREREREGMRILMSLFSTTFLFSKICMSVTKIYKQPTYSCTKNVFIHGIVHRIWWVKCKSSWYFADIVLLHIWRKKTCNNKDWYTLSFSQCCFSLLSVINTHTHTCAYMFVWKMYSLLLYNIWWDSEVFGLDGNPPNSR